MYVILHYDSKKVLNYFYNLEDLKLYLEIIKVTSRPYSSYSIVFDWEDLLRIKNCSWYIKQLYESTSLCLIMSTFRDDPLNNTSIDFSLPY